MPGKTDRLVRFGVVSLALPAIHHFAMAPEQRRVEHGRKRRRQIDCLYIKAAMLVTQPHCVSPRHFTGTTHVCLCLLSARTCAKL